MRAKGLLTAAGLLAFWTLVSLLGGWVTRWSVDSWYPGLAKPWFNPPPWVFAPVWTVLYLLLAAAGAAVRRGEEVTGSQARRFWLLYWTSGVMNVTWSLAFFGLRSVSAGLVVMVPLWGLGVLLAREGFRLRPIAGWLVSPYVLWVSFAMVLNATLLALNAPG